MQCCLLNCAYAREHVLPQSTCFRLRCSKQDASSSESTDEFTFAPPSTIPEITPEWKEREEKRLQKDLVEKYGISIRRRPPTGPSSHNVGPFQFKIENAGNTPRSILEEIIWHKEKEVSEMKERLPLAKLRPLLGASDAPRDFKGALQQRAEETGLPALIAEVKKASPSRGVLQENFDPVVIAKAYERGGAACLSVLTDEKYFQGSFDNLQLIRASGVKTPLLCKEFIVDAWQLYYARAKGADAILLIAAVLPSQDLLYMLKIAKNLGMAALIEVHDINEMDRVLTLKGVEMIGINNRNLKTFSVDIHNTSNLMEERGNELLQKNILVVGESGYFTAEDIIIAKDSGVNAVLVGESLVKQSEPAAGIALLFGKDISRKATCAEAI